MSGKPFKMTAEQFENFKQGALNDAAKFYKCKVEDLQYDIDGFVIKNVRPKK